MSRARLLIVKATVLILLPLLAGCGRIGDQKSPTTLLSEDFAISHLAQDQVATLKGTQSAQDADCITHIRKVSCLSQNTELGFDTKCSAKDLDPSIFDHLPAMIESLPPLQKKVFCQLDRLQLQAKIYSIGYANQLRDAQDNVIGNMVGIRPDALRGDQIPYDIFSWKEQLSFGLSKMNDPAYTVSDLGPRVVETIEGQNAPLVIHVLVHELSHLVDFMNKANSPDHCVWANSKDAKGERRVICTVANPNSFEAISWPHQYSYKEDQSDTPPREWRAKYPLLAKICYYKCSTPTPPTEMEAIYKSLSESPFVTAYASNSNLEDFAESSTVYLLEAQGFEYQIVSPQGQVLFDLSEHWNSSQLTEKKKWLQSFYSRANLKFKASTVN